VSVRLVRLTRTPIAGKWLAGVASGVVDPIDRLDWLTRAYRVGQIIRAAALFGVCDVLADQPLGAEQVAGRVGAAVDPMRRLLRTLVARLGCPAGCRAKRRIRVCTGQRTIAVGRPAG
jgi:hypothetical protein